ncbi:ABC transporter substrate-binding protein [Paraburkholderia agricolaris]|uniref:ABC transporter substrate-binding protein n=1 Tax=Paraburkholderia agricolaris TaxID=2152888 RepID=UPI001290FC9A|nr:ABC transporter substrate-binding protein [Paraburkholderia agricolaris]
MPRPAGTLVRALFCIVALAAAHIVSAQPIVLMTGGAAKLIYLPVILADQLGYFRREGLDVRVVSAPAGIDTSTELVAGAIQGAVGYYDHTIALQSQGLDVQSVVVLGQSAGLIELARRGGGMQTMADAKGRRLGVTGFGSSTYFLTRYLVERAGVAAGEYTVVPLANESAFEQALVDGKVDAGMIEEPTATRMLTRLEATPLVDMRSVTDTRAQLGGAYAGACLYMQRDWIDAHQDATARLVHAVRDALRFIQTHDEAGIAAAVPATIRGDDPALYRQALAIAKPAYSPTGAMPADAPSTVLAVLARANPEISARHIDLARTYTNRFVAPASTDASDGQAAGSH